MVLLQHFNLKTIVVVHLAGEGGGGAEGGGEGWGRRGRGGEGGGKEQPIRAVHYCPTAAHETQQSDVLHTYVLVVELTRDKGTTVRHFNLSTEGTVQPRGLCQSQNSLVTDEDESSLVTDEDLEVEPFVLHHSTSLYSIRRHLCFDSPLTRSWCILFSWVAQESTWSFGPLSWTMSLFSFCRGKVTTTAGNC